MRKRQTPTPVNLDALPFWPANFITFSTFGARVPGDARGAYRRNAEYVEPNRYLEKFIRDRIQFPCIELTRFHRAAALGAIMDACCSRGWIVGAVNVRTNHIHLLIWSLDADVNKICNTLKRLITARLRRLFPEFRTIEHVWARHFDSMLVNGPRSWVKFAYYTMEKQGENLYLTPKEWLWRSSVWEANPFEPELNWRARFDGRHYWIEGN